MCSSWIASRTWPGICRTAASRSSSAGASASTRTRRAVGYAGYARRDTTESGREALRRCFFQGNVIGEPTAVLFRKSDAVRGFSESYSQLLDLEMWFHLLGRGALRFVAEPLCAIRVHGGRATEQNLRWGAVLADKRRLFHAFRGEAERDAPLAGKLLWDARMAVTAHRTKRAAPEAASAAIEEVFYPRLFRAFTYPIASALWDAGLRRP
jgi:hypothetical protein